MGNTNQQPTRQKYNPSPVKEARIKGYWGEVGTNEPPQPVVDSWLDDESCLAFLAKLRQVEKVGLRTCYTPPSLPPKALFHTFICLSNGINGHYLFKMIHLV